MALLISLDGARRRGRITVKSGNKRSNLLREARWYLETGLFLAISFAVALLPDRIALSAGRLLGLVFFRILKRRRQVAIDNIAASLPFLMSQPEWDPSQGDAVAIARRTFENLGRSVVEDCKIYHGRGRHLIDAVEFRGLEHFHQALAKGKGVAIITAHCGNWELGALALGARCHEVSVVVRRQDNRHLNGVIERIRKVYGNSVIYKEGALRAMFAIFKKGAVVGMLIDQAPSPSEGVLLDFLGRPAWILKAPALIARKSGVPLVPMFVHREGGVQITTIFPEFPVSGAAAGEDGMLADLAGLNGYIERYIAAHPTEWYWVHKRWKRAPAAGGAAQKVEGKDVVR